MSRGDGRASAGSAMRGRVSRVALTSLLVATAADAAQLRGRVDLLARGGGGPSRDANPALAVAWFTPGRGAAAPAAGSYEMITRRKAFEPRVLAIPLGSTVRFPNADPILHNVFSVSRGNRFDLGFYKRGDGKSWTFEAPGVVRVFCNVHQSMVGYVVVLETRHHVAVGEDGTFALSGVPNEPGTLTLWHPRAAQTQLEVNPAVGGPVVARLEIARPRAPAHRNKLGKRYSRRRRDRYH